MYSGPGGASADGAAMVFDAVVAMVAGVLRCF